MKSNFSRIKKGYTVVGLILLLMLLTVWGWYLKTNQIEVFDAGDPPADPTLRTERSDIGSVYNDKQADPVISVPHQDEVLSESDGNLDASNRLSHGESGGDNSNIPEKSDIVNINTAGLKELVSLYGIGEVKARAIIAYREDNGLFQSIEEIMKIKGIGKATFERIKDYITIGTQYSPETDPD